MKKVQIEQDTQEWIDYKRTRIGGSGAKSIAVPLSRAGFGGDKTPSGFWDLVAEMLSKPKEISESPTDRGHRLETEAVEELATIVGLEFEAKPALWVSDEDDQLMQSSDGCEPADIVTYDCEIKSFTYPGKHFKLLYQMRDYKGRGFDKLQLDYKSDYRDQIIHGFIVNPDLKVRYFVSYYPEALYAEHRFVIIPIFREEVEEEISNLKDYETKTLTRARTIVNELIGDNF